MADRPVPTAEQIRAVWDDLDRPGPEKLQTALRKRGYSAPSVRVLRENFFKFQSSRQVFRHPPRYLGHIYSEGMDRRWQADIMQLPEAEHEGQTWKYALVAVDVFSRYAWAALIASPMSAAEGYRQILQKAGRAPDMLLTDGDPAFQTPAFKKALGGTYHQLKDGAQDLAVVDNLIDRLKRKQKQAELEGESSNWAARLQQGVDGFNRSGAPALHGSAPEDLRGPGGQIRNKELLFDRAWDESQAMRANAAAIHRRAENLQGTEAFRTLAPFPGPKRRIGDPVWSLRLHNVRRVSGPVVEDERGERFLTKEILPAHKDSTELTAPAPKVNARARAMLQRYADRGRAFLLGQPEHQANATRFSKVLAAEGNLKEALRLAGVSTESVIKSVVGLFPETFRLQTSKKGGAAHVSLIA